VNLLLALGVYGLLYVHTGVNYVGNTLLASPSLAAERPTLLSATNSLSGLPGSLSDGAIPQILLAYLLLLAWVEWHHDGIHVETRLARWRER